MPQDAERTGADDVEETSGELVSDEHSVATIEKDDPVASEIRKRIRARIDAGEIQLPRQPEVASWILDFTKSSDASVRDVIRHVRADPALAGKLLEVANSAAYAGSNHVYSLQMAIVRLGLNRVSEIALSLSGATKNFAREKRSNLLARQWKYQTATAFACEELARLVPTELPEHGFLTGLFHAVAAPAIVDVIGELERAGEIAHQSDSRILGLLDRLTNELTLRIVRAWNAPTAAVDAIRFQDGKLRDRRGKPLAHILVCGKAIATELGMGTRPQPIVFETVRDFHFLKLDTLGVEPVRDAVLDKMMQVAKV